MNIAGGGHTLSDVALDITVECLDERGARHEIDTVLGYRSSDPFAVAMTFITPDGNLVWTFGRDLLTRGIESPSGDGDVHVSPAIGRRGRAMVGLLRRRPAHHPGPGLLSPRSGPALPGRSSHNTCRSGVRVLRCPARMKS